ncbi:MULTISPECIES: hypothetical protein [Sphingobacterium]|uniref:Uncharacterized protein n=1 Tax=Sphingobacterium populi TaxID=1812824 RepID=A0ABW5UIT4_9SPHI|nr:hypothetical protein [Sphingobacterium sp. CFCC 11742]
MKDFLSTQKKQKYIAPVIEVDAIPIEHWIHTEMNETEPTKTVAKDENKTTEINPEKDW